MKEEILPPGPMVREERLEEMLDRSDKGFESGHNPEPQPGKTAEDLDIKIRDIVWEFLGKRLDEYGMRETMIQELQAAVKASRPQTGMRWTDQDMMNFACQYYEHRLSVGFLPIADFLIQYEQPSPTQSKNEKL